MAAARKCIILTGAPLSDQLDWSEEKLLSRFNIPLQRTAQRQDITNTEDLESSRLLSLPKWRSILLDGQETTRLEGGVPLRTQRTNTETVSAHPDDVVEYGRFVEHSIAVLEDLETFQLTPVQHEDVDDPTALLDTTATTASFYSDVTDPSLLQPSRGNGPGALQQKAADGTTVAITDLCRLPNAADLQKLLPQTVTVNLIAGIITVRPSRAVRLRRRNAEMDIIEVVLGDDTKAGFTVSFWLAPDESQSKPSDDLRGAIHSLRTSEVVLLSNVALSSFKRCVYGQSLNKRFARNSTTITSLTPQEGLPLPFMRKVRRVQDWADQFVGGSRRVVGAAGIAPYHQTSKEVLPPDTQE